MPTLATCPTNGAFAVIATPKDNTGAIIGPATTSYYYALGRVLQVDQTAFAGGTSLSRVTTQYNLLGQTVLVTQPYLVGAPTQYSASYQYDKLGWVSQTISADNLETLYGYSVERRAKVGHLTG
ncbi:MAG TPA: hypothetical protein VGC34_04105 [Steroidobacteraceae bacterium]